MNEPTDLTPNIATVVLIDRRQPNVAETVAAIDADFVRHNGERNIWPLRERQKHEATVELIRTGGAA